MKEVRMLLAWVQTFLINNMLLAEAYGSGDCFWDNGHLYRADQPSPAPGVRCLNWLEVQSGLASAPESDAGNHSYCRNPDQDPRGPWCYVSGDAGAPEKWPCEDLRCPETEEASEVPSGDEVQVFAPANALPARSEAAAVQPVIGISQRVRVNSKEKKDLGTLGYVLGITMMVIIIAIGAGIVLGYTYKRCGPGQWEGPYMCSQKTGFESLYHHCFGVTLIRGKDLKEQHDQQVCEREMQRITLPLSAFTNPTCEIVDEKTIVVHTNQTPVDLQEGSAPLMGQAGTPGA
ncbi:phosphoinositide-3-kinase-interacting protein 1 isoform X2 [Zalophus californianus]|uniref:Phosphoinositide-3-kinase-interacting protein 1 isoform X2 n=1 Tax=Zalophus californianus TaxID=9704 RepID=A0A6J2BMX1_ZALCA|nr:phosphoinositide-3-kinase-interacting protein 1 isoform X2 [Zalophus californianus]